MFKKILSLLALVVLFAACSTTPEPTPDPGDNPEPGSGSLPQELQGEWFAGSISSIQFYDPITGDWAAPNGSGFYMIFKADGSYEEGAGGEGRADVHHQGRVPRRRGQAVLGAVAG